MVYAFPRVHYFMPHRRMPPLVVPYLRIRRPFLLWPSLTRASLRLLRLFLIVRLLFDSGISCRLVFCTFPQWCPSGR